MSEPTPTVTSKATRVSAIVAYTIGIDLGVYRCYPFCLARHGERGRPECEAERAEEAVREFMSFLKDHRSQSGVSVYLERERGDTCSACGLLWDTVEDDGKTLCGNCGVEAQS